MWAMHDVWGWDERKDEGVVLRESYFRKHPMTGAKVRAALEIDSEVSRMFCSS